MFLIISLTGYLCREFAMQAEKVFNQDLYFKKTVKYVGEPMSHLESIASSAVLSFGCSFDFDVALVYFQSSLLFSVKLCWF